MMTLVVYFSIFVTLIPGGLGSWGFKGTAPMDTSTLSCLKSAGATFLMARCWTNQGRPDFVGVKNLQAALNAGMSAFSYFVPCVGCTQSPSGQVSDAYAYGQSQAINYGGLFLQLMTSASPGWSQSQSLNINYIRNLTSACNVVGAIPVLWSAKPDWNALTGNDLEFGSSIDYVAYTHFDGNMDENDWNSAQHFGSFPLPYMKEYQNTTLCGIAGSKMYAADVLLTPGNKIMAASL